jgi:hypothetical protein
MSFPNPVDYDYPYSGNSQIAADAFDMLQGYGLSTGVKDLMAYPSVWPSDFTWQRLVSRFDETMGGYASFASTGTSSNTTTLKVARDSQGNLVIGKEEAKQIKKMFQGVDSLVCEDSTFGGTPIEPTTNIEDGMPAGTLLAVPITELSSGSPKLSGTHKEPKKIDPVLLETSVPTKLRKAVEMTRPRG